MIICLLTRTRKVGTVLSLPGRAQQRHQPDLTPALFIAGVLLANSQMAH